MKCSVPMRHFGAVDIGPFCAALARQHRSLWIADLAFRKKLAPERETKSIYLFMTTGSLDAQTKRGAGWAPLHEAFEPLRDAILGYFRPGGRLLNAQLAMIKPRGCIPLHFDRGAILEACHRIHVPLETHKDVIFEVDGAKVPLEVGQVYELDNTREHSVLNASPVRRIHLILDYYDGPTDSAAGA